MSDVDAKNSEVSQESICAARIVWIVSLLVPVWGGIIMYFVKKGDKDTYIVEQAKEAANWSITMLILCFTVIAIPFLGLANLAFTILGIMKTGEGQQFKVPFAIRLLK